MSFQNGEGAASVIDGFTLTNGTGTINPYNYRSGGAIYCYLASPRISNNVIRDNHVTGTEARGGGIFCGRDSDPTIVNNRIHENSAPLGGGIFCGWDADPVVTNNTILSNSANNDGGGFYCYVACSPIIANTIFRGNQALRGRELYVGDSAYPSTVSISHSNVEGGQTSTFVEAGCSLNWGAGMIDGDPIFVSAAAGDYHITGSSPCREAGTAAAAGLLGRDFENDVRPTFGDVDIGADEFAYHLYLTGNALPGGAVTINITGEPQKPVLLALATGVYDPPVVTPHGHLYLKLPLAATFPLGPIPTKGVLVLPTTLPAGWVSGSDHPFQALAGPWGGPASRLTNLLHLRVE